MEPIVIEVKSLLKQGLGLFSAVMTAVDTLQPGQSLVVRSTFSPRPLISQMKRRGYTVRQEHASRMIITIFTPDVSAPMTEMPPSQECDTVVPVVGPEEFLDNRGFLPPEPMQRTWEALAAIPTGSVLVIHNDRVPIFLLGQLDEEGFPYEIIAGPDDSVIVKILKVK
ncbi:Uncharacterized conserved protein [Sulfobacillus thermosulfidooxidans DSM 9293]|uniref:Uncharacterized conserved protein n=1 Tax=Sulfobacillus thermosulfidooxidans (strain DSM 9293 / VKM B-1269 / AT-1) TaxID=929705 RepID=A0A1W1WCL2_SULTA|nr:DUF2249 domain-containing protein [Sulfobacillus thermosulfidooxidans]SMC03473.1 Uncharacterized conserved protein [Sulfobacillus thermosulfidooxidans DSM 9293]